MTTCYPIPTNKDGNNILLSEHIAQSFKAMEPSLPWTESNWLENFAIIITVVLIMNQFTISCFIYIRFLHRSLVYGEGRIQTKTRLFRVLTKYIFIYHDVFFVDLQVFIRNWQQLIHKMGCRSSIYFKSISEVKWTLDTFKIKPTIFIVKTSTYGKHEK